MKNRIKFLLLPLFVIISLSFNGCILDAFDTLTSGVPLSVDLNVSGSNTTIESSTTFNLDENNTYKDNKSKIKSIKFVKVAYRTKSVNPPTLTGNITLTVKKTDGTILFTKVLPNLKPSDYVTKPMELGLTQAEIQLLDAFLAATSNRTFTATLKADNLPSGDKNLQAVIDIVFEMEYNL
jgi:hypothetical protein